MLAAVVVSLLLAAPPPPIAGDYYQGDGLGVNWSLALLPSKAFVFVWRGCLGEYGRAGGTWTTDGEVVRLEPSTVHDGGDRLPLEYEVVRWGTRVYLVPPRDMPNFFHYVESRWEPRGEAHGMFFMKNRVEGSTPSGPPQLPASYRGTSINTMPRESFREGHGQRTIVMLGDDTAGAAMFAPHAHELARDFDVIRVQTLNVQAANTFTPMPASYSVDDEAEALQRTLAARGVRGAVDLVGASYGGVVALRFALKHPEAVRTLTLFEPPALWLLPPKDEDAETLRALAGLSVLAAHREDPAALERLHRPVLLFTADHSPGPFHAIDERLSHLFSPMTDGDLTGTHFAVATDKDNFVRQLREFLAQHP